MGLQSKWYGNRPPRYLRRHWLALSWLSYVMSVGLLVGTFTSHLWLAVVGLTMQYFALYGLLRPISMNLLKLLRRTRVASAWLDLRSGSVPS